MNDKRCADCIRIAKLDAQGGKGIFGGGLLLSDRADGGEGRPSGVCRACAAGRPRSGGGRGRVVAATARGAAVPGPTPRRERLILCKT